jgi:tRNA(Ile)-lysidine synthetase-like protein
MLELKGIFKNIYDEWFNNKHNWFNIDINFDRYIIDKYWKYIENITIYNDELCNEDKNIQIGAIIALDQIPRHYNRLQNINVQKYSKIAEDISVSLMSMLLINTEIYESITANEWCFILLPTRHLKDIEKIQTVIHFIIEKHNNNTTSDSDKHIYKRFLENTLKNYYKIKTNEYINNQKETYKISVNKNNQWTKYNNILHHIPNKSIIINYDEIKHNNIIKEFEKEIKYIDNENIIVSLSGGVDSMVSLYLCKIFFPYNNIIAIHINYDNRDECEDELKFVKKYCAILNIKLYYRTIEEIKRNDCHQKGLRELYENITKDIRLDMYKQVANLYDNKSIILLGHNKDDCFENIITNISMKNNYENLSGISRLSVINDIAVWRPLLNVRKNDIIHFAMNIGIPFLKNSTPSWSSRGKIRDVILPSLQNINPSIMDSFYNLKDYLKESNDIINEYIINKLIDKFAYENNIIVALLLLNDLIINKNIWDKIFNHSIFKDFFENTHVSFKALNEFIVFIERFKKNFERLQINKKYKFILKKNISVIIFKTKNDNIYITFIRNTN